MGDFFVGLRMKRAMSHKLTRLFARSFIRRRQKKSEERNVFIVKKMWLLLLLVVLVMLVMLVQLVDAGDGFAVVVHASDGDGVAAAFVVCWCW